MSNTVQETFTGFASTFEETRELPRLNCIGRVTSVGEGKVSANGTYVVQPLTIEGTEAAPSKSFVNLLYRPEWLVEGFDPRSLEGDGTSGIVYKMHIGGARDKNSGKITQVSTIAGIAGSEDNFNQLAGKIFSATKGQDFSTAEKLADFITVVSGVISEFVNETAPEVGFYSSQKKKETGEVDASGRKVKVADPGKREVSGYFFVNAESDKRNADSAAKGKSVQAYTLRD